MGARPASVRLFLAALVSLAMGVVLSGVQTAQGASQTFVVDRLDDSTAAGAIACTPAASDCTFRGALNAADLTPDADTIVFDLPGAGPHTIVVASPLNTQNQPVTIDGYCATCDGATPNSLGSGSNALLKIEINCAAVISTANCINLNPPTGTTVMKGLAWNRSNGVAIRIGGSAENVHVEGCFIGTNLAGTAAGPGNRTGIVVAGDHTTIGGTTVAARNIISGNTTDGLVLDSTGTSTDTTAIINNYIGVTKAGTASLGNGASGIVVGVGATAVANTTIGSNVATARNLISGNGDHGIVSVAASGLTIFNNDIGFGLGGVLLGNDNEGIRIQTSNATVGPGNVIGGHDGGSGILITGASATGNTVTGNSIGISASGTVAIPNVTGLVLTGGANGNFILNNTISRNTFLGMWVNTNGNTIRGNAVGTNAAGTTDQGNGTDGILLEEGDDNIIGGTGAGEANTISGNGENGITLVGGGGGPVQNHIVGNRIGTNTAGTSAIPNAGHGIDVQSFADLTEIRANTISGNEGLGVYLQTGSVRTTLLGNRVGTNAAGTAAIGNASSGVLIESDNNTVGGLLPGEGNLVSGNASGIGVSGAGPSGNKILGNIIGATASGLSPLPQFGDGILLDNSVPPPSDTEIRGNVIVASGEEGIDIQDGNNITIAGNSIGVGSNGLTVMANNIGIGLQDADSVTIGGAADADRNIVSGNVAFGIALVGGSTTMTVSGNIVGLGGDGLSPKPNGGAGLHMEGNQPALGLTTITNNTISANGGPGMEILPANEPLLVIKNNRVGTALDGVTARGNTSHGMVFGADATATVGGVNPGEGNTIAFNGGAGVIINHVTPQTLRGNSIHSNVSVGIASFIPVTVFPPVINSASPPAGTACANCLVDIYSDADDEGKVYHGFVQANGAGTWTFNGAVTGPNVTATATTATGRTSAFSAPLALPNPVPVLVSIEPSILVRAGSDVTIVLQGSGFVPASSQVTWDATQLTFAPGTATETSLSATVPSALLQSLGDHLVKVVNPAPDGGQSAEVNVRVRSRADANCDLAIVLPDAVHVRRVVAGLATPASDCDPDADGNLTVEAADALFVLRVLAGLEPTP